jgi:hypothetical protein
MAEFPARRFTANSGIQRPGERRPAGGASGSIGSTPCGHAALKLHVARFRDVIDHQIAAVRPTERTDPGVKIGPLSRHLHDGNGQLMWSTGSAVTVQEPAAAGR